MVGEGDSLAGVEGRHVAPDAIPPGRDRAEGPPPGLVAGEAGGLVGGPIGRNPVVRVVAIDTTEGPVTPRVARRLHQADRLEPGDPGVVGADLPGGCLRGMAMT